MRRLTIFLVLLCSLAIAPAAHAYSSPEVGMVDDNIMLGGTDSQVSSAVNAWQAMGVDTVRLFARWSFIAPAAKSKKMPAGFDPSNPDDPRYNWAALDRAVNATAGAGMKPMITITGSGPYWGMSSPSNGNRGRRNPSPAKYAAFASAVAKRYASKVDTWIIYNEPNQVLWLQDQSTCKGRTCTPHSPNVYRKLVLAAEPKIRAADPGSAILIGALAPIGSSQTARNKNMRPLDFLRAFACVNSKYQRITTGECKNFKPAIADGFAYHPHGIRLAPNRHAYNKDDAQIGDLGRLTTVLDRLTAKGRIKVRGATRFPLYLDEYAYQTNPPDKFSGVTLAQQATYMRQGYYIAWKNSRVRNISQYVYVDEKGTGSGWQSGLFRTNGAVKPSFYIFPIPFWAQKLKPGSVQLWGQVRPGTGVQTVQLQRRSGSTWTTIDTVTTDPRGYYFRTIAQDATATYRALTPYGATATTTIFGR